jgi:hypothetical protein
MMAHYHAACLRMHFSKRRKGFDPQITQMATDNNGVQKHALVVYSALICVIGGLMSFLGRCLLNTNLILRSGPCGRWAILT